MNPDKEPIEAPACVCDPEEARENRKLQHWLIKGAFRLFCFIVIAVVLAVVYDVIFRDGQVGQAIFKTFFSDLGNIFKIMFESTAK